jgi:hypothetical protein
MVLSLAGVSQAPAAEEPVAPAERQKAVVDETNQRDATPKAKPAVATEAARQKARKLARRAALRERDRREFEQNAKLQAQAREEYRKMLPFLLENQRQQLERMSAYERNLALNRIAAANAASARAINNLAAAEFYNGIRQNTGGNNATHVDPYGIGITPVIQGVPSTTIDPGTIYNNVFPIGGVSVP